MKRNLSLLILTLFSSLQALAWNPPTLSSPANNASVFTGINLNWNAVVSSQNYQLQVDTTTSFNSPVRRNVVETYISSSSNNNDTQEFIDDLFFGTTYYWRVRAYITGDTSSWVQRSFTTNDNVSQSSPANNASGFAGQTFNWNAHTGVDFYDLEVDTSQTFNSPALQTATEFYISSSSNNNDTQEFIDDLYFGTTYYWRVRARNAVDTSAWSSIRVYNTQDDVSLSSPANNAIGFAGQTFNWNAHTGVDFYDLELDTTLSFNSTALKTATESYISSSSNNNDTQEFIDDLYFGTTYYWRVRARNAVDTTQWSVVRIYNTQDDVTLSSPANNALGFAGMTFNWNAHSGIDFYDMELDTSMAFNSAALKTVTESYISSSSNNNDTQEFFDDLYFGTVYYWRVRARNAVDTTQWSVVRIYNTLDNVTLSSPANNALGFAGSTFNWNAHSGVDFYDMELDTSTSFNSPALKTVTESYISSSSNNNDTQEFLDNLYFGAVYYWRVRARNAVDTTQWSVVRIYNTGDEVTLSSPTNNALGFTGSTFNWNAHAGIDFYDMELDTSTAFNSPALQTVTESYITSSNNNNDTQEFLSDLYFGAVYYWRVRARNAVDTSAWSTVRIYNTRDDVTLSSPSSGTNNIAVTGTTLNWNAHAGVDFYEMELDSSFQFNSGILTQVSNAYITSSNNNNDTQAGTGALLATTVYYWRVRAINAVDTSIWTTWVFSTGVPIQVPAVPNLVSPANGASNTGTSVALDWDDAANATDYEYQYALNPGFTGSTSGTTTASNTSSLNLAMATTYYWRVRALNGNVSSTWSSVWSFDTGCNLAAPVVSGQSVCEGDEVVFTIAAGSDFHWYDVPVGGTPLVSGSSYNYGPALVADTIYVAAFSGSCEGPRTKVILGVSPLPAVPVITQTGSSQLTATGAGITYQWFLNGNLFPQTGAVINTTQNGTYTAVAINADGCESDTSAGYPFIYLSVEDGLALEVVVSPNPNQGTFQVKLPNEIGEWELQLVDLRGEIVWEEKGEFSKVEVQLPNLSKGIYLLRSHSNSLNGTTRILIQ